MHSKLIGCLEVHVCPLCADVLAAAKAHCTANTHMLAVKRCLKELMQTHRQLSSKKNLTGKINWWMGLKTLCKPRNASEG